MAYPYGMDYQQNPGDVQANTTGLPLTPGGLYGMAFKGSYLLTMGRYSNWDNLIKGKGLRVPGIIGLRSIAAGQEAFKGVVNHNPLRWGLEKGIGFFNKTEAFAFKHAGLFGRGGIWENKNFSKFFGGGDILKMPQMGIYSRKDYKNWLKEWKGLNPDHPGSPTFKTFYQQKIDIPIQNIKKSNRAAISELISGKGYRATRKAATLRLLGTLGKGANIFLWAQLGYDVGKMAGRGLINLASASANALEAGLSTVGNRNMEFNLSPGFLTSGAATERQRALQAISQTKYNARMQIGQEGQLSHTASTW